ncbi:Hypothetical predicted protein [Pelobates cultripes]|uniref:Uncharacterized protein n=1 Tax=Pelobates cultripes TaxID=61616 RepID=A0AAD1RUI8_PELCU|nr:Hypothetical predicted protein [Pelobates cultripes]
MVDNLEQHFQPAAVQSGGVTAIFLPYPKHIEVKSREIPRPCYDKMVPVRQPDSVTAGTSIQTENDDQPASYADINNNIIIIQKLCGPI